MAAESASTATITLPSDREIRLVRVFNAPRPLVFEAWIKPEHVKHWWDPSGRPLAACEIDLRPGGSFRFVNSTPHGPGHVFTGTYREIIPPARLVFGSPAPGGTDSLGTLEFEEGAGTTTLILTMTAPSKRARDAMLEMRIDAGTAQTLNNLTEYLAKKWQPGGSHAPSTRDDN
jgi:uncharacterized protein YndB with AHSA1/START domain